MVETAVAIFLVLVFLIGCLEFGLVSVARFTSALAAYSGVRAAAVGSNQASENAGSAIRKVAGLAIDPALLIGTVQGKIFPHEVKREGKFIEVSAVYYRPESAWRSIWQGFSFHQVSHRVRLPVEDERIYAGDGETPWQGGF